MVKDVLAGFDAVLGAKTKEVAERETGAKTRLETAERVIKGALESASKNWDLYKNIDFLALAKRPDVTAEALTNLRNEAQAAWEHFDFLNKSAADVAKTVERASAEDRNRAAKALLDRADRGDGFGMGGVVAVAHVDAEGVGAGAHQLFDHFRAAAGGAEGGKDLYLAAAWIKSGQCVPLSFAHRPMAKQGQTQGYPR